MLLLLSFNGWLKGRVDWRIEILKLFFVMFKMIGEVFIKFRKIDSVSILIVVLI